MKKTTSLLLGALIVATTAYKAQTPAADAWRSLTDKQEVVSYFSGMFNSLGIKIAETGETLTILHTGNKVEIVKGADSAKCDYYVVLHTDNVERMQQHGADGKIDENESFMIMAALFTPFTTNALSNPILSDEKKMKMGKIENHIVVNLYSPDRQKKVSHTLIYINSKWVVIAGVHGTPKRIFNLTPEQAIEYQRKTFAAQKVNTMAEWKKYGEWYANWRKTVSQPVQ